MTRVYSSEMEASDPVRLGIYWEHENSPGNLYEMEDWHGDMLLTGYRYDFYRTRSELERVKREMVEWILEEDTGLKDLVYGSRGRYRLVVDQFKIFFQEEWGRNWLKISLPRAHNVQATPELWMYAPYPALPELEVLVYWKLRVEPAPSCPRPVFHDFFDALLRRRNPPPRSRKHRKRLAKRRRRLFFEEQLSLVMKAMEAAGILSVLKDQSGDVDVSSEIESPIGRWRSCATVDRLGPSTCAGERLPDE